MQELSSQIFLVVYAQGSGHTEGNDADGCQGNSGTLAEGEQVEERHGVRGRFEGVKEVQQEQRRDYTSSPEGGAGAFPALGVEG